MIRTILVAAGAFYVGTGGYLLADPAQFYLQIPGVSRTGAFNEHFLRDVGLAFLISGATLIYGAATAMGPLMLAGALWPAAHGLFHIQIWVAGGCAPDPTSLAELGSTAPPSLLALALAIAANRRARLKTTTRLMQGVE